MNESVINKLKTGDYPKYNQKCHRLYKELSKGAGVHWPEVDEDLSLKGFLKEEIDRSIRDIKNTRVA